MAKCEADGLRVGKKGVPIFVFCVTGDTGFTGARKVPRILNLEKWDSVLCTLRGFTVLLWRMFFWKEKVAGKCQVLRVAR